MATDIASVNAGVVGYLKGFAWLSILGWAFAAILLIGAVGYVLYMWRDKKLFNKKITVFEIVGGYYCPGLRDTAKTVKLGKGGFEVLYLKKSKTWKIAWGGRVGKDTYYFFVGKDGYWYNGMLSGDVNSIDKEGGLTPIVTTNPLMRAQYTALEKQIDSLHSEKKSFMEKYGQWIAALMFVLIAGFMLYLSYKEYASAMSSMSGLVDKIGMLMDRANQMLANTAGSAGAGGLIPKT